MTNPKLIAKFRHSLLSEARLLFDESLRLCDDQGIAAYLVGGPLRDLLLAHRSLDIDIAVEANAPALVQDLARRPSESRVIVGPARPDKSVHAVSAGDSPWREPVEAPTPMAHEPAHREESKDRAEHPSPGPRAVIHPTFLTATVRLSSSHIDLITARSETYARPGALPAVRPATIREDLLRRDFTINALALRLNGPDADQLLDPTGGMRDINARLIRILHERSFQDDATRILRAFRYAVRLGFEIEQQTLAWLKRDLRYLDTISGARLHHELTRILAEYKPEDILLALNNVGALAAIHPAFRFDHDRAEAFARLRDLRLGAARAAYWPSLAWHLSEDDAAGIGRRLAATRRQREAMLAIPALHTVEPNLARPTIKRSAVAEMLEPFPLPALWALAALTEHSTVRERIHGYLTKARYERPHITGDDLLALGVPHGPRIGEILRHLTAARLDGEITSREDEERVAQQLIAQGIRQTIS